MCFKRIGQRSCQCWQKTRDLALLGLASYSGKGGKEIEEAVTSDTEAETDA